ncbi:MAG TPA: SpoIIE family protein phosphatase [Gemmata sp.]|jgi:serine phosphatase RsbU (regulator of sigma subunit)/pSer/pThr/pTyr-binding forkhead associated (FHA) protein|nr:SpoIIE family protein phosphatase [Gemmata sp.]
MPSLILLKSPEGATPNKMIALSGDPQIIGRDADRCQIVIPHHAVSREHAKITSQNGFYFIEDLKSRNHTFVNSKEVGKELPVRTQLKGDDRIKICDFLFQFRDDRQKPRPLPIDMTKGQQEAVEEEETSGMTTIEAMQGKVSAQDFLQVAPSERLRALLEISTGLAKMLDLDSLLPQVAETLFGVFKQADRCFVIFFESGKMIPKAVRARRLGGEDTRFSKTIVRKTMESMQSYLSEDASSDISLGPAASIAEFKIRSVMCVPLATSDGQPLGAIQLDTQDRAKKFITDDLNMLTIVANLAGVAIEKARLHETVLAREKEQKEIELARKVQLGFLPQTLPEVNGYEFFSHYSPAQTVGGDYYDFVPLPGGRCAVVLGDVAGKGVPAALLVAKLSSEVRFCLVTEPNPGKAISLLNDQMLRGGLQDRFVTLTALILDPVNNQVLVVNAGHMSPKLFVAAKGTIGDTISEEATGPAIGFVPGYQYEAVAINLDPGDVVSVFTDGVTDAMNQTGLVFGSENVDKFLLPEDKLPEGNMPKRFGERLVSAVRKHANGHPQNDDIAIVCFGRLELERAPINCLTKPVNIDKKNADLKGFQSAQ